MDDYYALIGIDQVADDEAIREALKRGKRAASHRAAQGATLEVRQEAERRRPLLLEAEKVLLDRDLRREYDDRLRLAASARPPSKAVACIQQGWQHVEKRNWHKAKECGTRATEQDATSADAWLLLGTASSALGHHDDAAYELNKAIVINPANPEYPYVKGNHLLVMHDATQYVELRHRYAADALECYLSAHRLAPGNVNFVVGIGRVCRVQGRTSDAIAALEHGLTLDGACRPAIELLCRCLLQDQWVPRWRTLSGGPGIPPGNYPDSAEALQTSRLALARIAGLGPLPETLEALRLSRADDVARLYQLVFGGNWGAFLASCVLALITLLAFLALGERSWLLALAWYGGGAAWYYRAARVPLWVKGLAAMRNLRARADIPPLGRLCLGLLSTLFIPLSAASLAWQNRRSTGGTTQVRAPIGVRA